MSQDTTPKAPSFVLGAALPLFTWTVRVPVPGNDDYLFAELPITFQAVDQTALDKMQGLGLAKGEASPTDTEICHRVVKGWPSLKNADGDDVPFSPESLDALLQAPTVRSAIVATFIMAMQGRAARKNA